MASLDIWGFYDSGGGEDDIMIWLIVIGLASGVISGMGIGGGTILIPALSILFDYEQKMAQNINLIYFIPTAIIALITHVKNGRVEKKVTWKIIIFGVIGAIIGSMIAINMDSGLLRKLFGWFLLLMGISEVWKGKNSNKNKKEMAK